MIFYDSLYYFVEAKEGDIIVGEFNFDAHRKSRLPQILSEYVRVNIRPCVCKEVIFGRL